MTAMSVGPFLIPGDRMALLVGGAFLLGAGVLLARVVDRRFAEWSSWLPPIVIVAGRVVHIISYPNGFLRDPLLIFAIWDGGVTWWAGLLAAVAFTMLRFKDLRMRSWTLGTLAATLMVWNIAWQLVAVTPAVAAPEAALPTLSGEQKSLKEFAGRPTVVNLWATWCPPCRKEMPMLVEAASDRRDVNFVFANQGEGPTSIVAYMSAAGLKIDNLLLDQFRSLSQHYAVQGYPATVFLDARGVARKIHYGEITREALEAQLAKMKAP